MRIEFIHVTCSDCGVVSQQEMVVECLLSIIVAAMEAMRCPECGNKNLTMGGELQPKPEEQFNPQWPLKRRAQWWIAHGDRGASSETIFATFLGGVLNPEDQKEPDDYPHDADDFQRCYRLLELIPEWRGHLDAVAVLSPGWIPFVRCWDSLEILYREEQPNGRAPRLSKAIKSIIKNGEILSGDL